jgi:hypothetical protein
MFLRWIETRVTSAHTATSKVFHAPQPTHFQIRDFSSATGFKFLESKSNLIQFLEPGRSSSDVPRPQIQFQLLRFPAHFLP